MKTTTLTQLLQFAGVLHLGLIWAGATMPRAVNLRAHLAGLPPLIRKLFFVYYAFVGLSMLGFGTLTFLFAPAMAAGEPVARALCGLMLVYWTARLIVAAFVFDVRPYLTNVFFRVGNVVLHAAFIYLVIVYAVVVLGKGLL